MTAEKAKIEITKLLDELSDESILQIYQYLQALNNIDEHDKSLALNVNKILREDKETLEKLAQ